MSISEVNSNAGNKPLPSTPSKWKTYAFLLAIIVGIAGLTVGGVGVSAYFQAGKLSQIQSIYMMSFGGGGGLILLIIGIWGRRNSRTVDLNVPPTVNPPSQTVNVADAPKSIIKQAGVGAHPIVNLPNQVVKVANPPKPIIGPAEFSQNCSQGMIRNGLKFGKAQWQLFFGGNIGVEPALPVNIDVILNQPCPFAGDQNVKVKDTHMLMLIPATVNGIPLTLDELEERMKNSRSAPIKYNLSSNIKKEHGNSSVGAPYWILMPREVIPGSTNKGYRAQLDFIGQYPEYSLPSALEVAICLSAEYLVSSHLLLKETVTRCSEASSSGRITVGFTNKGLFFGGISDNFVGSACGFTPVRRFAEDN